jgi:hypothetical protein
MLIAQTTEVLTMPQLMLIDGERVPSVTGEYFDVHDPATEEVLDPSKAGARLAHTIRLSYCTR